MRTNLRAQLSALRPCEVVLPATGVSSLTRKVLMASLRKPRINSLPDPWSSTRTLREIDDADYFKGGSSHPQCVSLCCSNTVYTSRSDQPCKRYSPPSGQISRPTAS